MPTAAFPHVLPYNSAQKQADTSDDACRHDMRPMTDLDCKQTQQIKEEYFYHFDKNAQYKFTKRVSILGIDSEDYRGR